MRSFSATVTSLFYGFGKIPSYSTFRDSFSLPSLGLSKIPSTAGSLGVEEISISSMARKNSQFVYIYGGSLGFARNTL